MKQDIMIVANDTTYFSEVCKTLCRNKMKVIQFDNIIDAKAGLAEISPAILLLNYGINGANFLLDEIMSSYLWPHPYIVVIASFSNSPARAAMLRKGADVCVEQPVAAEEVLAIIEAVLRRGQRNIQPLSDNHFSHIKYKELTIKPAYRSVTMRGIPIALTRKEYDVLFILANHAGSVMTKEEIYTAVWKTKYDPKATNVSDQISSLRRKLGLSSKDTNYIQTVIGVGYRFGAYM